MIFLFAWWDMEGIIGTVHEGVSENRGVSPQIIHFDRVFHCKPSILGYPYFWKHPWIDNRLLIHLIFAHQWGAAELRQAMRHVEALVSTHSGEEEYEKVVWPKMSLHENINNSIFNDNLWILMIISLLQQIWSTRFLSKNEKKSICKIQSTRPCTVP